MSRSPQVKFQLFSVLYILPKDVLRIIMMYNISDIDRLFILLTDPFLPPGIYHHILPNRFSKQRRVISLYCSRSLDPFIKSFGCILPDEITRNRRISYEDWYEDPDITCSGWSCDQCNPLLKRNRHLIVNTEGIKSLTKGDLAKILTIQKRNTAEFIKDLTGLPYLLAMIINYYI